MYDLAIIGAGAAGLMAASVASENGVTSVLLEGNSKIGKKLLATGNGRCNLSNLNINSQNYFGDDIADFLEKFPYEKIKEQFNKLGLITKSDSEGRVYPLNLQAVAVLNALRFSCENRGVELLTDFNCFSSIKVKDGFLIKASDGREIKAKKLIISSGGMASPKHSSSKDGYEIAKSFGHSISPLYPVLTKLLSSDKILKSIEGTRCKAEISLCLDGEIVKKNKGEILFSKKAVSGICVFDLSVFVGAYLQKSSNKDIKLNIDFCPDFTAKQVYNFIKDLTYSQKNLSSGEILSGVVNTKIAYEIVKSCGVDVLLPICKLSDEKLLRLSKKVKEFSLKVDGISDFESAQVTAGGVPVSEIDINTFESKKQKGLYFAGEILNVHGLCGGFNLHFAWSSAICSAQSATDKKIIL